MVGATAICRDSPDGQIDRCAGVAVDRMAARHAVAAKLVGTISAMRRRELVSRLILWVFQRFALTQEDLAMICLIPPQGQSDPYMKSSAATRFPARFSLRRHIGNAALMRNLRGWHRIIPSEGSDGRNRTFYLVNLAIGCAGGVQLNY